LQIVGRTVLQTGIPNGIAALGQLAAGFALTGQAYTDT